MTRLFRMLASGTIVVFISTSFVGCGSELVTRSYAAPQPEPEDENDADALPADGDAITSAEAFEQTTFSLLRTNCVGCHQDFAAPFIAAPDAAVAHAAVMDAKKVDKRDLEQSRLVQRLRTDNHNCWSDCNANADEMLAALEAWFQLLEDAEGAPTPTLVTGSLKLADSVLFEDETVPVGTVVFEAESGSVMNTFTSTTVVGRSGGMVVGSPDNNGAVRAAADAAAGVVVYTFEIAQAGTYRVFASVRGPDADSNAFYIRMDNGTVFTWNIPVTGAEYQWDSAKNAAANNTVLTFNLTQGMHTLTIREREDGSMVDLVAVTNDTTFTEGIPNYRLRGQKLTFPLDSLPGGAGGKLEVEVSRFDDFSYKFKNPRITLPTGTVRAAGLHILINDEQDPLGNTFALVDETVIAPTGLLSPAALILPMDKGPEQDQFKIKFDVFERK